MAGKTNVYIFLPSSVELCELSQSPKRIYIMVSSLPYLFSPNDLTLTGTMKRELQVQAADSLLKLVSELKQTAIFSGFATLNDHVEQRTDELNQQAGKTDGMLAKIGEEAAASLTELESHYYSSVLRTSQLPQQ